MRDRALPEATSWYRRHRYGVLFYFLLVTMVADPILAALGWSVTILEWLLAANLLAAVAPLQPGLGRRVVLSATAAVCLVRLGTDFVHLPIPTMVPLTLWVLAGLTAAGGALRFALRASDVTAEHLYAALSAYLLAGLFFGLSYWVLEQVVPGTFPVTGEFTRSSAQYFSFVTLATLGYGDITPAGEIGRGLAVIEGVGGQLFLAVMVARLVSVYGARK
jgi:hypothetical protein